MDNAQMKPDDALSILYVWTPFLAAGFLWNILISAVTMAVGTPVGLVLARGRLAGSRLSERLTSLARLPPTFVLMYYFAYILPGEFSLAGYEIALPGWLKASLALSVAVAGFVSDAALSSILHYRRGEAAEALYFIPAWTAYFLIIIMASSTASVIGVPEIVQRANTVIAAIADPRATLWVYAYTMLWFLAFCWPLSYLLGHVKTRLGKRAENQPNAILSVVSANGGSSMPPVTSHTRHLAISAGDEAIATIQSEVEDAAGAALSPKALFGLKMSIEELIVNIMSHGGSGSEPIDVSITVDPEWVSVSISDDSIAFNPFSDAPPPQLDASVEERRVGGLGIHLVAKLVDRSEYERRDGRNHVHLSMRRTDAATDGDSL